MSEELRVKSKALRKRRRRAALGAAIFTLHVSLFTLSGCAALPQSREIESMALMRTLGVDVYEDGVSVTASSGVQSKGVNEGTQPPQVFSKQAKTVSGACLTLQSEGDSYLFYGHVGQLLLGEEQAVKDVTEALDYVERDLEMRLDTELFVVKGGGAGEAISATATQDSAAVDRLEALEQDAGLTPASMPRTVKDVLAGLAQNGASFAPAVSIVANGEKKELMPTGYAVFKDTALVGWAEGDAARGVNLIWGRTDADVLELTASTGEKVALRLVGAKTSARPVFDGEILVGLDLDCTVEANVAQAPDALELNQGDELERLRSALSSTVQRRVRQAVDLSQRLDADFLGLAKRAGLSAPWRWAAIQEQWGGMFAALPVTIRVEAKIERGYDIKG